MGTLLVTYLAISIEFRYSNKYYWNLKKNQEWKKVISCKHQTNANNDFMSYISYKAK